MRRSRSVLLSTVVVVPFLAGCAGGDDTTGSDAPPSPAAGRTSQVPAAQEPTSDAPTSDAPDTEAPAPGTSDDGPAFPEGTARQTAENSGEWDLVLTDVRVGEHEGFDRIVLEFAGTGVPGWTVNYVDEARLDGSGKAVTLGGEATLDIYASGTTYPEDEADGYGGPRQFEPASGGDVDEVHVAGTFEGYTQVLAGIDGRAVPFRVFALAEPPRLVVDVVDRD
jgi:hypothetical protein